VGFARLEVGSAPAPKEAVPSPGAEMVVEIGDLRVRVGPRFDPALLREVIAALRAASVTG
jgi:hypothetical protein